MHGAINRQRQSGAVIVTVALTMLFLLGFMGIAIDFGRLFVVKAEMQTALDSCALAAAGELDGGEDWMARATNAGRNAGNQNKVLFQSTVAGLIDADVTFSDALNGTYGRDAAVAASYVKCLHTKQGMATWLLQAFSGLTGDPSFSADKGVYAVAVATRAPSQTACMIPVGVCSPPGGFHRGEWYSGVTNENEDIMPGGQFRWLDFGQNGGGAREIKDILSSNAQCNLPSQPIVTDPAPGKTNGAVDAWNTRFGIYRSSYDAAENTPDFTGHAWYVESGPVPAALKGRYDDKSVAGYQHHAQVNDPYQGNNQAPDDVNLKVQGKASSVATHQGGASRRVVVVPVLDCPDLKVNGSACMFMLHPLQKPASGKTTKMWLEYLGDANAAAGNPCVTSGLPGGSSLGARVPALVQ
jgi:hypothetical protein